MVLWVVFSNNKKKKKFPKEGTFLSHLFGTVFFFYFILLFFLSVNFNFDTLYSMYSMGKCLLHFFFFVNFI